MQKAGKKVGIVPLFSFQPILFFTLHQTSFSGIFTLLPQPKERVPSGHPLVT